MGDIKSLVDSSGIILAKDVANHGISRAGLADFVKRNGYEKVSWGVYVSPDAFVDENYVLSLRCPCAVFSHDEALYYYGLIDREPMKRTITVYTGYGRAKLEKDGVKIYSIKKELLEVGKTIITNSFGHKIPMYDMERTICDMVRSRSSFEIQDYTSAVKNYAHRNDKDLNRLMHYAKLLRVEKKVREYMEVLL